MNPILSASLPILAVLAASAFSAYHPLRLAIWAALCATATSCIQPT